MYLIITQKCHPN